MYIINRMKMSNISNIATTDPYGYSYTPNGCVGTNSLGVAKRIYTAHHVDATTCRQVLNTPGDPGGVFPAILPNGCYSLDSGYYGIWVIPDSGCLTPGDVFEWENLDVMSCNDGKLNMTADLDLQDYDRNYWEAIEKTTPLYYQDSVIYPETVRGETGTFETYSPTCQQSDTYWADSRGNPGYDSLGCVGRYGNTKLVMYRAYLSGIDSLGDSSDWCSIVRSTPGNPNGIYSFPSGCEIEGNRAYGIWVLAYDSMPPDMNGVIPPDLSCTNELVWNNSSKSCVSGVTKFIAFLSGLDENLTDAQRLAIANKVPFNPPNGNLNQFPNSTYIQDCNVFGMWNGGSCTNSVDTEFFFIVLILVLAFIIALIYFAYQYWITH